MGAAEWTPMWRSATVSATSSIGMNVFEPVGYSIRMFG
jgi:hypothetical protein